MENTKKGVVLMLGSSFCVCVGQLLWKLADSRVIFLLAGFAFYGLGAILMIYAYKFGKVSNLQPILSVNYVIALVLGKLVLDEPISLIKCVGVIVIIIGVYLIARESK